MTDEKFVFVQDVKDKKITARSARNRRTHNGKGGAVKFPSDYMTRKEKEAMNGEVKSYRLNSPMTWKEFKALPDDVKVVYIKALRQKFNCFDSAIAEMLGINKVTFSNEIKRLGLGHGTKHGGNRTWKEKDAFYAWAHGVNIPVPDPVEEAPEAERQMASLEKICDPVPEVKVLPVREDKPKAMPCSGNLTFEGRVEDVLNTVSVLLGGGKCPPICYMGVA